MKDMLFLDILNENKELRNQLIDKERVELKILSNITLNQLVPILEYTLRIEGINGYVTTGEYDNIIQESLKSYDREVPLIFWELCNLKQGFVYELEMEDDKFFEKYLDKVKGEFLLISKNLATCGLVLFNKFSHIGFSADDLRLSAFEKFVDMLNAFLIENAPANFILVDLSKIISKVAIKPSFDWRGYYSSKSLYSINFLKEYSSFILPALRSFSGKSKKAIIFDCDNTLWKGIVGEDGIDGIELSESTTNGIYFKEVQLIIKRLIHNGVIFGLCSKNNEEDVSEVFRKRLDITLTENDITIKKINWQDKANNLINIAMELNIGIDSIVFVDDSNFEINLIKETLPDVKTLTVPKRLYNYPQFVKSSTNLFFNLTNSVEDLNRTKMYKQNVERGKALNSVNNIEEYLSSLSIKVSLDNKNQDFFERLVQLTQKTNQFNLTTQRYAIGDMRNFYDLANYDVISLEVEDKFGSFGVTGLCIIKRDRNIAEIDSFLMSCRILGRNIELIFLEEIIHMLLQNKITLVKSSFIKTEKNSQVEFFFDTAGFTVVAQTNTKKEYELDINNFKKTNINYIQRVWKKR